MIKKRLWLPLLIVLVLALTACSNMGQGTMNSKGKSPMDNDVAIVGEVGMTVGPVKAFDIYMDKYPSAKVEEIDLNTDSGLYVYDIEGYDGNTKYELKISGEDGSLIKEEIEEKDSHKSNTQITKAHVEKIEDLVSEALGDAGKGAKLDEWTLEFEGKVPVLKIEIMVDSLNDIEYYYNVETGKLIKKE